MAPCIAIAPASLGQWSYNKHLKIPNNQILIMDMTFSAEKLKRLIKLVQNKNISAPAAADTVYLNRGSFRKHYQQYLKDPQYEFLENKYQYYTERLIDYIDRDKMSVESATKSVNMKRTTAHK